eukprot:UN24493
MEMAAKRTWYIFTPEMDLQGRFDIHKCPSLVFAPRKCNGWTEWCKKREVRPGIWEYGCNDFKEQCTDWKVWDELKDPEWTEWVKAMVDEDGLAEDHTTPARQWLKPRQSRTETTAVRNAFMPPLSVHFTENGFTAMKIPKDIYDELIAFYHKWEHTKYDEEWNSQSNTVINYHEMHTTMVSLDKNFTFRNHVAEHHFKPICETWSGLKLKFESFYGIREYYGHNWLRHHIDRL